MNRGMVFDPQGTKEIRDLLLYLNKEDKKNHFYIIPFIIGS